LLIIVVGGSTKLPTEWSMLFFSCIINLFIALFSLIYFSHTINEG
jgi:hypothetical protein